jgi:hypothetical protein
MVFRLRLTAMNMVMNTAMSMVNRIMRTITPPIPMLNIRWAP